MRRLNRTRRPWRPLQTIASMGGATGPDHRVDDDHWEQPGNLFRLMTRAQQQALFENARAMGDAREHIKQLALAK
jgi:catalase